MRKYLVFSGIAILLSDVMCAIVAFNYGKMLSGTEYEGYSAPAQTAFLWAIPFMLGIAVCIIAAVIAYKRR